MKDRIAFYLLTSLALSGVFTLGACCRHFPVPGPNQIQTLRFDDKTGRSIQIGALGNVHGFHGMRPMSEGYAIAYQDPKSPGKVKVVYSAGNRLSFGLKPVSLTSNVPAGTVAPGQEIKVTAVLATDDDLIQFTHEFRWTAGNYNLEVTRNIKQMGSDAVRLRLFNGFLTLDAKEFSRDENMMLVTPLPWSTCSLGPLCPNPCPPPPDQTDPPKGDCPIRIALKVLGPVGWAVYKSSNSAKRLLEELSQGHFTLPKLSEKSEKYDVVFGLGGDSLMLKDRSLALKYVYDISPNVRK